MSAGVEMLRPRRCVSASRFADERRIIRPDVALPRFFLNLLTFWGHDSLNFPTVGFRVMYWMEYIWTKKGPQEASCRPCFLCYS